MSTDSHYKKFSVYYNILKRGKDYYLPSRWNYFNWRNNGKPRGKNRDGKYQTEVRNKLISSFQKGGELYNELNRLSNLDTKNPIYQLSLKLNDKYIDIDDYIKYDTSLNNANNLQEKNKRIIKDISNNIDVKQENNKRIFLEIKKNIEILTNKINSNNNTIDKINDSKQDLLKNSYSISYIENLLLQSYSSIYDAIVGENNSINNNTELRLNNFSIDQSLYLYKLDKIQFYKNINTFLFYFYFIFF